MFPLPRFIYGLHDLGGENLMIEAGKPGWILHTAKANDPALDFSALADMGVGIIVRLNHGYGQEGTIPPSSQYATFAKSCADYVGRSRGAHVWLIGNEMNISEERPQLPDGSREVITPDKYARCFAACRAAIQGLPGHEQDWVVPGAVGPYNAQTGDWVQYLVDILNRLSQVDAIALHCYTHDYDANQITDERMMDAPHSNRHFNFRAYRDFLNALPVPFRTLPVLITETNPFAGWRDTNVQWIQSAYAEIDAWNADPAHQPVQALVLFRWQALGDHPEWGIEDKGAVRQDFLAALGKGYLVRPPAGRAEPAHAELPGEHLGPGWCPFAIKRPVIARNFSVGREGHKVQAVVLHIVAGNMANVLDTFNNAPQPVSAHFCVGKDGTIEQYVSIDDTAYGNGLGYKDGQWFNPRGGPVKPTWQDLVPGLNPNLYTISIEHDGWPQEKWTQEMRAANTRLLQWIAQRCALVYVPHRTLIGHCEIDPSKPDCPGALVDYVQIAAAANAAVESPAGRAAIQASHGVPWLAINVDSALYKYARACNLGGPQTDEFEFQSDGAAYVGQMYSRGIVYVKKGDWGNAAWTAKPEAGAGGADATANAALAAAGQRPRLPINTESALYKFAQAIQIGCPQTDEFEFAVASKRYVGQVYVRGVVYAEKENLANIAFVAKPEAQAISFAGSEAAAAPAAAEPGIVRARRAPVKEAGRPAKKVAPRARKAKHLVKRRRQGQRSR